MSNNQEISLSVRSVIIVALVLGLSIGFATGIFVSSGSNIGQAAAPSGNNNNDNPSPSPTQGNQDSGSGGVSISFDTQGEPVLGQEDAPVTIAYWGDFQCPFCKRYEQNTFPQIRENYISNGKVRYVFKDFQFLGQDSTTAGIASECAWEQTGNSDSDAYWNWHAAMFENQDGENSGWGNKQNIISITESVQGVNAQQLSSCMENNQKQYEDEMDQDQQEGRSAGVTGTPGFVIYKTGSDTGQKLTGAQPYNRFKSVISQVQEE